MSALLRAAAATAALVAAVLLQGCATPRVADDGPPWMSGRLSVRVDANAGQAARSLDAGFALRGDDEQGELRLATPLGTQIARARWTRDEALLDLGQGETRYPDLESLSRAAVGEVLPLRALPDWLAGRPWPGAAVRPGPEGFEQLGWQVSLARLAERRLEALREQPRRVLVRVRLEPAE